MVNNRLEAHQFGFENSSNCLERTTLILERGDVFVLLSRHFKRIVNHNLRNRFLRTSLSRIRPVRFTFLALIEERSSRVACNSLVIQTMGWFLAKFPSDGRRPCNVT